jgi:transforming growth factor-beta-induced protein
MPAPACPPRWSSCRGAVTSACALATLTVLLSACGESSPPPAQAGNTAQRSLGDIVDVAQVAGQFSTLLAAAEAAGLVETLRSPGPFTVFAPTDGAFSELPDGTVDALLADPEALAQILLYHVVPGTLKVADLRGMSQVETAQGSSLTLATTPQGLTINGEYLLTSDISASNGVIHVITAVLTP